MAIKDIVKGICNITRCKYDVYTKEKIDEIIEEVNTELEEMTTTINDKLDEKVDNSSVTSGTADPSGGKDGDIYFQYQ